MKYTVEISDTYSRLIEVEAGSREEANEAGWASARCDVFGDVYREVEAYPMEE
jgi:hypothetical protein